MHVLLPVDGSEAAQRAVQFVRACAAGRAGQVTFTLVNIQPPSLRAWPGPEIAWEAASREIRSRGDGLLAPHLKALSEAGHQVTAKVVVGSPASTILEIGREEAASVVVMGTRGSGPLGGFALGSVALRVAPSAACPVVLVKPDARLPSPTRDAMRVLAPLDGSALSDLAVARLLALGGLLGPLHVDLVHFEPALTLFEAIAPPHDDVLRAWSGEESRRAVARAQRLLQEAGVPHEVIHVAGDPASGIAELAARRDCDLIAMATHGTGALHHATFGSVTLKTVSLAGVPVMFTH